MDVKGEYAVRLDVEIQLAKHRAKVAYAESDNTTGSYSDGVARGLQMALDLYQEGK